MKKSGVFAVAAASATAITASFSSSTSTTTTSANFSCSSNFQFSRQVRAVLKLFLSEITDSALVIQEPRLSASSRSRFTGDDRWSPLFVLAWFLRAKARGGIEKMVRSRSLLPRTSSPRGSTGWGSSRRWSLLTDDKPSVRRSSEGRELEEASVFLLSSVPSLLG